jgi:hypothetical protein
MMLVLKWLYSGGVGMAITKEVLDELLKEYWGREEITGKDGLLK